MTYTTILILFAYFINGYATARKNNGLKLFSYPIMVFPLYFDVLTTNLIEYKEPFTIPAWQFIITSAIVVIIIVGAWLSGYGLGRLLEVKK